MVCARCERYVQTPTSLFCVFCKCIQCNHKAVVRNLCVYCIALKLDQYERFKVLANVTDDFTKLFAPATANKETQTEAEKDHNNNEDNDENEPWIPVYATTPRKLVFHGNSVHCACGKLKGPSHARCGECHSKWKLAQQRHKQRVQ
jgi:hypothetical protein